MAPYTTHAPHHALQDYGIPDGAVFHMRPPKGAPPPEEHIEIAVVTVVEAKVEGVNSALRLGLGLLFRLLLNSALS